MTDDGSCTARPTPLPSGSAIPQQSYEARGPTTVRHLGVLAGGVCATNRFWLMEQVTSLGGHPIGRVRLDRVHEGTSE